MTRTRIFAFFQQRPALIAALTIVVVTLALWLPFGFYVVDVADSLVNFTRIDDLARTGKIASLFALEPARPLGYVWLLAAWALTPDSFLAVNLFTAAAFIAKGLCAYGIMTLLLPGRLRFALAVALLTVLAPVDSAYFYLGTMHIHIVAALYLLAVYALLRFWQTPGVFWAIVFMLAQALQVLTYEATYPLIAIAPLALMAMPVSAANLPPPLQTARGSYVWQNYRQFFLTCLLWYLIPALLFFLVLLPALRGGATYQSGMLNRENLSASFLLTRTLNSYTTLMGTIWLDLRYSSGSEYGLLQLIIAAVSTVALMLLPDKSPRFTGRTALRIFAGGLLATGAGFAAYLPTAILDSGQRAYFFAAPGVALCITVMLLFVISYMPKPQVFFVGMSGLLLLLCAGYQLNRHAEYTETARARGQILQDMGAAAPGIVSDTDIVLIVTNGMTADPFGRIEYLTVSLAYWLRDDTLRGHLCYGIQNSFCRYTPDGIEILHTEFPDYPALPYLIPYDKALIFVQDYGEPAVLLREIPGMAVPDYQPEKRMDEDALVPQRKY